MFRSSVVAIMSPADLASIRLGGTDRDIPIIGFGERSDATEIRLSTGMMTPAEQVAWLRGFAHQVESLAEIIEAANANPPTHAEHFECTHCDAAFGIAGPLETDEDWAADSYFREQVAHHATGQCRPTAVAR